MYKVEKQRKAISIRLHPDKLQWVEEAARTERKTRTAILEAGLDLLMAKGDKENAKREGVLQ